MDIREKIKERMTEKVIRSKFLKKLYFSFWKIVLFFLAIIQQMFIKILLFLIFFLGVQLQLMQL